jgi:hypothetical protein
MITLLQPLAVGNAIRVFYSPPLTALTWKILRKLADTFTGYNDVDASVVAEHGVGNVQLDTSALTNGVLYYYKPYWWDGAAWHADATVSATPVTNFSDLSVDPLVFMRERLDYGFQALIAAGKIQTSATRIPVLTAPPMFDDTTFPVVTVHCNQDSAATRGIGEMLSGDVFDVVSQQWESNEGWYSRIQLSIVCWCLNPDERVALRRALKSLIIANLQVFYDVGFFDVEFQQSDNEDFQSYNVPMYQVMNTFTCQAASAVGVQGGNIQSITVAAIL